MAPAMTQLRPYLAVAALLSTAALVAVPSAGAQELAVTVTPSQRALTDLGTTPGGWMMIPYQQLYGLGPNYTVRSGIRIGRGYVIPDWIETASMESVTIPRLQPYGHYQYFVSSDRKLVVMDPSTRQVVLVMR